MPEVLTVATPVWTLSVWTKEIDRPRQTLQKTLAARNAVVPSTELRFSPPVVIYHDTAACDADLFPLPHLSVVPSVFFENRTYDFEFVFPGAEQSPEPRIVHWLKSVEDGFRFSRGCLRGSINFGNDVGWFRLGIRYEQCGRIVDQYLSFEVLPLKMDMAGDLKLINQAIDNDYPLWHFSFARKTEHEVSKVRKPHERFPLLWLALFRSVRENLEQAVKLIVKSPHSRLLPLERYQRPDRLKGRTLPRLEETISDQLLRGEIHRRYRVETRRLSVDTPENRFVKMVLTRCARELNAFILKARMNNAVPDKERLSSSFFEELESWVRPLEQLLAQPLFREAGEFTGLIQESLVLQQRAGYAKVYRVWQDLKLYLDVLGRHATISMKSVAELYEVWCLLEIKHLLLALGFEETPLRKAVLREQDLEKQLKDGMGTAFRLFRKDGDINIRLAHEPVFSHPGRKEAGGIFSWTTDQKPDILLEATFGDGSQIRWIFDAKYRIDANDQTGRDMIPIDAINQMHRYRDALIQIAAKEGVIRKTRPIVGAFVLYPGLFDEETGGNPYAEAIEAVGIGGFPLLPGHKNLWLNEFLRRRFGDISKHEYKVPGLDPDQHLVHESVRIAPTGLSLIRYDDLTLAASLGGGRDQQYVERFRNGTAGWYHVPVATADKRQAFRTVIQELRFCAVAVHHAGAFDRQITYLYNVVSVHPVKRSELTIEQAGQVKPHDHSEFWLLRLGGSRRLDHAVRVPGVRGNLFYLISMAELLSARELSALKERYSFFTRQNTYTA
jgi:uncharacterized protein